MNKQSVQFIEQLAAKAPQLQSTYNETVEYWKPEVPPVTIAFAELGQSVFANADVLGSEVFAQIMDMIEMGVASDDDELSTAVATGFIESAVVEAARTEGGLDRALQSFRAQSRAHAEAWVKG